MNDLLLIIFGASGDLAKKKLIPALFKLYLEEKLPLNTKILGVGRTSIDTAGFREMIRSNSLNGNQSTRTSENYLHNFLESFDYLVMDPSKPEDYLLLKEKAKMFFPDCHNYIFYMATPPQLSEIIPKNLFLPISSGI